MLPYLARSAAQKDATPQSYHEHVLHVLVRGRCYLRRAMRYARELDKQMLLRTLELAAEYHDLGKLDDANQAVLTGIKRAAHLPLNHVDAGVAYLEQGACLSALLVYAHHAGLPDINDIEINSMRNTRVYNGDTVAQWVDRELPELLKRHNMSVRPSITQKEVCELPESFPLAAADIRILFSCLTQADHGDAARATGEERQKKPFPKLCANERLKSLKQYVQSLMTSGEMSERNQVRSLFFDACYANASLEENQITICDAPVGTGKTTAIMAYLLGIAAKHRLRRIFIVLPFTNIIMQSVKVYRKALVLPGEKAEDVVAEIHHRADFENKNSRTLTALWDAPIVVTTAVAFFETLASASPARLRRLQNLPGSAIFLDEAHAMLPSRLLPLVWQWIQHTATTWSCQWMFASGSLCHFWELDEFKQEIDVAKPNNTQPNVLTNDNFSKNEKKLNNILSLEQQEVLKGFEMNRIRYEYKPEAMSLNTLAKWLYELEGPVIVVLNTVHTAAAAAKAAEVVFGKGNALHLSTSLTPKDRDITLELVKARLKYKCHTKWCLLATSCVEAGVDLSFRNGVRECASLLSLLQLAGRVNRNSEFNDAIVWTISLNANDAGVTQNPVLDTSSRILREFFEEGRDISPDLCTEAMCKEIRQDSFISNAKKLCKDENIASFREVELKFRVIDDDAKLAIVDKGLIEKAQNYEDISWQDIQHHSVRVRKNICQQLSIEESKRYPGLFLWNAGYTPFLGYMEAVLALEKLDKNGFAIL
jgi:CRISPR-associated endonuclease Cas3-HD